MGFAGIGFISLTMLVYCSLVGLAAHLLGGPIPADTPTFLWP